MDSTTTYTGQIDLATLITREEHRKDLEREVGNVKTWLTVILALIGVLVSFATVLIYLTFGQVGKLSDKIDKQADSIAKLAQEQAVTNERIGAIQREAADTHQILKDIQFSLPPRH